MEEETYRITPCNVSWCSEHDVLDEGVRTALQEPGEHLVRSKPARCVEERRVVRSVVGGIQLPPVTFDSVASCATLSAHHVKAPMIKRELMNLQELAEAGLSKVEAHMAFEESEKTHVDRVSLQEACAGYAGAEEVYVKAKETLDEAEETAEVARRNLINSMYTIQQQLVADIEQGVFNAEEEADVLATLNSTKALFAPAEDEAGPE